MAIQSASDRPSRKAPADWLIGTVWKDPIIEANNFSYKRYDHFVEWLGKFQNNARCNIPKKVYGVILKELKRRPFDGSKTKISKDTVKDILKKTNNTKYNDQASHIMTRLNSKPVPRLPKEVQEKMKHMFKQTQKPFSKICPNNRTNFLHADCLVIALYSLFLDIQIGNFTISFRQGT